MKPENLEEDHIAMMMTKIALQAFFLDGSDDNNNGDGDGDGDNTRLHSVGCEP